MKISKWTIFLSTVLFAVSFTACGGGGGKYAEVKTLMEENINGMEDFITAMDKADNASAVAAALNAFAGNMADLKPKMEALEKKHPELKSEQEPPAELQPLMKSLMELSQKMMQAMMKVTQYEQDPDVQKAQEELNKVMR